MIARIHLRALAAVLTLAAAASGQELKQINLPRPQTEGGKTVMQALQERRTTREFSGRTFSAQMLSNLLWAAYGVNRPNDEHIGVGRTAPSAFNRHSVQVYVLLPEGVFIYDAEPHVLKPVVAGDIRSKAGPEAAANAAATLVYVSDADANYAPVESGFIAQNVYLFSAAFGLNAWFRALGVEPLPPLLKLTPKQRVLYTQSVGYPK
jgi:nitroreductase